jgi:ABC-2 type transport system ATP-binding protein
MDALSIDQLTKTYGNGVQALKGINLKVAEGDFFALLGPNGAGKTTTIGIITSLVRKSSGTVKVFGVDISEDWALAKSFIGIVPQEMNFNQFETPETILTNQAGFYGISHAIARERVEHYLKTLQLLDKRHAMARSLSGGMKRRLMIARALIHEPKLLILDEPTAGVDIEIRRSMWEFLKGINEQGVTIILTTHYLEEAENLCRHLAIINQGQIQLHDKISAVLGQLQTETFVLNTRQPISSTVHLPGYVVHQVDAQTLEIESSKDRSLNEIFVRLAAQGVEVVSMRNKVNRLEELFLRLTQKTPEHTGVTP